MFRIVALGAAPHGTDDLRPTVNARGAVAAWVRSGPGGLQAAVYESGPPRLLGTLPGLPSSAAAGINAAGVVVGVARGPEERNCRAFVCDAAGMRKLATPTDGYAAARAINDAGLVVGAAASARSALQAVVWEPDGAVHFLDPLPGGDTCVAQAVNVHGDIVGASNRGPGLKLVPCLWKAGGKPAPLPLLAGGTMGHARAVNDRGLIVGYGDNGAGDMCAVAWRGGAVRDLGNLGDDPTAAFGVDATGRVVGSATNGRQRPRAFLYKEGVLDDLTGLIPDDAGWTLLVAYDVNARGQVVGRGGQRGRTTLFRLDPDPSAPTLRPRLDEPAADFALPGIDGKPRRLSALATGPTALWFFCNCDACHRVARVWGQAARQDKLKGLRGVAVFAGDARMAKAFVADTRPGEGLTFLLDPDGAVAQKYRGMPCPQYRLLDAGRTIRFQGKNRAPEILVAEALSDLKRVGK